ncbi:uncharacterized protein LOC121879816 [Homarus americanus]|uniref:uncharacterized protein LOC121879816 n=1 Tax=Homarus americanus TaxID=6706 RepID=UPI001C446BB0|nr:uncharacterized protein LOC121879816 [Homarus americanus]
MLHYLSFYYNPIRMFPVDISNSAGWWWERLIIAGWMLMMLVLARSYCSTLMSLLAVRYIPQPYQSLRDVLDDPSKIMIWECGSFTVAYYRAAETGIFTEVADAEREGRVIFNRLAEYPGSIDKLVREGSHVILETESFLLTLMAQDFSQKGQCDFYYSRDGFLSRIYGVTGQKNNPLVPSMSKRILAMSEFGLYDHWRKEVVPNSTSCLSLPTKITVSTSLSVTHLWGLFTILVCGYILSLLVFSLEIFSVCFLKFVSSSLENVTRA